MSGKRREIAPAGLIDLANERLGGAALVTNDEFFAPMENLVRDTDPIWQEGLYTERGKWMDGWESRRRRTPGHDWCILRLGLPGIVHQLVVDTAFFRGNFPEACSVEACALEGTPTPAALEQAPWAPLLDRSLLQGDHRNVFDLQDPRRVTHLRLNIFPDGGVARLRVYGQVLLEPEILDRGGELDLAALEMGGRALGWSDAFFGAASSMLLPGRGINMGDGWETRRRRGPGHDWAVIELATQATLARAVVDTWHFKGNAPGSCEIEGANLSEPWSPEAEIDWRPLLERSALQPHTLHTFALAPDLDPLTHVRLKIHPDGGVSRLRLFGHPTGAGRRAARLRHFNALAAPQAAAALLRCCAAPRWAGQVADQRPFDSLEALLKAADEAWALAQEPDWRAAFDAHPRLGERKAAADLSAQTRRWSQQEQSGLDAADDAARQALAEANRAYEERFGFIFLLCASGLGPEAMLEALRQRLPNAHPQEIRIAAAEQHRITRLRLERMFS